jgi:hypothetical protein
MSYRRRANGRRDSPCGAPRTPAYRLLARRGAAVLAASGCMCALGANLAQGAVSPTCNKEKPPKDFPNGQEEDQLLAADTAQSIEELFDKGREFDGCTTPMHLPEHFLELSPQEQLLWLLNSEREVRGREALKLDATLMSQISLTHSEEMSIYEYFDHPSPINRPGPHSTEERFDVNPAIASWSGENIFASWGGGLGTPAACLFGELYADSGSEWGHRENYLGTSNWVGLGLFTRPNPTYGTEFHCTVDFESLGPGYTPPATRDTHPPEMGPVTYAGGTASVADVKDSPLNVNDTGPHPASAGVTGVVFYANKIVEEGGKFNTVPATEGPAGTWTATIAVKAGDVLHAVAVDGSGNFKDESNAPPTLSVASPAGGATYLQGQSVLASYSCSPPPGASITACSGPLASGAAIDTATLGAHSFTVNATDSDGQSASESVSYTVIPAPVLAISAVSESARRWVGGSALAKITAARGLPVGTTFSFTLNLPASVTLAFTTPAPGRRAGKACQAPSARNKHGRSCTRTILAGTLKFTGHTAVNRVRFQGLISRHQKLRPGSYTLTIKAAAPGQHTVSSTLHFRIG